MQRKKNLQTVCQRLCAQTGVKLCVLIFSVCACRKYAHTWLHYSDILSCPDLRLITTSSSSWGGSTTVFSNSKYVFSIGTMLSLN